MKNLKFKKASAYNFLPFGPEGIELDFAKYKNLILIKGENKDAKIIDDNQESKISSNGTGKSSLQEIIVYGLFGKTVKRPEKLGVNDVVHNKVGKDCKIELLFDDYKLIRTRKENGKDKHGLRLWHSPEGKWDKDTEITQGTMAATQKKIEDIIGLSYDSFINMCIFTDDQRSCFLESDSIKKKEIVENLLSLGIYREWFDNAKVLRKEIKSQIDSKIKEYQFLISNKDDSERRLKLTEQKEKEWRLVKNKECENIKADISSLKNNLSKDNSQLVEEYLNAQKKITECNDLINKLDKENEELSAKNKLALNKLEELKSVIKTKNDKCIEYVGPISVANKEKENKEKEINNLKNKVPGTLCGECKEEITEKGINSFIEKTRKEIECIEVKINSLKTEQLTAKSDLQIDLDKQSKMLVYSKQFESVIEKNSSEIRSLRNNIVSLSKIKEPVISENDNLTKNQIEILTEQLQQKIKELEGDSPFKEILENDYKELNKIKELVIIKDSEVKDLEKELPYYEYWIHGFGDNGIRKWVVDGIIPELNDRINYWLQFLIDNKISLVFDNELNEKIERNPADGDPYVYHAMSTGQRRRLNLAVSQSFAHIMTLSSGSIPSVIFLDEVSTNVDPLGVQGIFNMINELAEDKQVFVTTHDKDLMNMLQTADVINLCHENGYTKLVK